MKFNLSNLFSEHKDSSREVGPEVDLRRRALLALPIAAVLMEGCSKIEALLGGDDKSKMPLPNSPATAPPTASADPNRPAFLDEGAISLKGLVLLMANNDTLDRYIFNAITGNTTHAQSYQIAKGIELNMPTGQYTMPYHAILFKPFDPRSNLELPKRLGAVSKDQSLASFFRKYTVYRADRPQDLSAIKTILVTSYELSFGVKLDPNKITIEDDGAGHIKGIKYAEQVAVTTTIATGTQPNPDDPESKFLTLTNNKNWNLVGKNGELFFPPSAMSDQGIALPHSAFVEYKEVKYRKTFQSQGKTISLDLNIPIDSILEEQGKLQAQGRPQNYQIDAETIGKNLGYYILENDPFIRKLAEVITAGFSTKREKMQAILDFAHSYNYVPDAYGEAPRTPLVSLICKGGDCEDSSILVVALARSLGIDCIFVYFDGHAAPACDIEESGTALTWNGKRYEWCETTGGEAGITTITEYQDPVTLRVVRTEKQSRGWKIGEKPKNLSPVRFVSHVEDAAITRMGQ